MADNNTSMGITSLERGRAGCDIVQAEAPKIEVESQNAQSAFQPLTFDPDFGTSFINELTQSLDEISNFLKNTIYTAADQYYREEEGVDVPATTGGNNGTRPGPGPGGGGGNNPKETTPDTTPATTPTTTPTTTPGTNVKINLKPLEEMSLTDLFGLSVQLIALSDPSSGATLDDFFKDDKNADNIKKLILESPYVPESIKTQFKDLDSKVVKQAIYDMLMGKNPEIYELNNLNKVALYKYLETVATNNGKTVDELISDSKLLKDTLTGLGDVVELVKGWEEQSTETFQDQLKSFYYGDVPNEFPDQDIYATRAYVDYLSTECEVGYDELLNDSSYAETLKKGVQEFGKSLSFFTSTSFFSDKTMQSTIKSAMKDISIKVSAPTEAATPTDLPASSDDTGMQNMFVGNDAGVSNDTTSIE